MLKKLLSAITLIFFSVPSLVFAQTEYSPTYYNLANSDQLYHDVDETNEYYLALRYLTKEGIIEGYQDGYYRPNDPILRAELMKMLMDVFHDNYSSQDELSCFPDTPNFEWYTKRICKAKKLGFVHGFKHDGLFHPDWDATRAEAAKMILNTLGVTPTEYDPNPPSPWLDLNGDEWFYSFAKVIQEKNLFNEDWTYFYPYWKMDRGLAAELLFRSLIMIETGMETFDPEAISTWEFGGHDTGTFTVERVNMDDTIYLSNGETVRLIGVNRPDFYAEDCYVDEAQAYIKNNLLGREVELKKDAFGDNRNPQEELLRYVYIIGEGHTYSFNYQILYDGYAYLEEPDLYQFYYDFRGALNAAYATGRGLWNSGACRGTTRSLYELRNYPTEDFIEN